MDFDALKQLIHGEIENSEEIQKKYSRDASIFEVKPTAVIFPKDKEDLKQLIRYVTLRKQENIDISLTARNGGTCMSGGSLTSGYILDMSRHFNKISNIDTKNNSITVQGGVMHIEVEKVTHPSGMLFPPYTSSHDICGVGGMIGNNASGEKSVKYGPTSANVASLRVVLSDGEEYDFHPISKEELEKKKQLTTFEGKIYREVTKLIDDNWDIIHKRHPRVKKNAAGYALYELWDEKKEYFNMARLFIGAQGTLGITTEAKLKLVPMAKAQRMVVVPIGTLSDLSPVVTTFLKYSPETVETFDFHTYDLAKKLYPEDAKRAEVAEGKHMIVFAIYAGNSQEEADKAANEAKNDLEHQGKEVVWINDNETIESVLLIRRKSFKMLLEYPHENKRAMPFIEDTIVDIKSYAEFLAALEKILSAYDMTYTYAGHIGDGSIRLVPLANMEKQNAPEEIIEVATKVYDLVFAFGGSISVDHNDGLIRTPYLEQMYGTEIHQLFKQVKHIFDPHNIFNPGKKIGSTLQDAMNRMIVKND